MKAQLVHHLHLTRIGNPLVDAGEDLEHHDIKLRLEYANGMVSTNYEVMYPGTESSIHRTKNPPHRVFLSVPKIPT